MNTSDRFIQIIPWCTDCLINMGDLYFSKTKTTIPDTALNKARLSQGTLGLGNSGPICRRYSSLLALCVLTNLLVSPLIGHFRK